MTIFARLRLRTLLAGTAACALVATVGSAGLVAALGDTRTLSLYNIHTKETTTVLFRQNGKPVPGAMDKLNWALRDWRRDQKANMDPELMDLLWEIHTELGSKAPIHVISGFRSKGTNDTLRSNGGGQASESRHITGQAIDVHFPDVDAKKIRYSALIRERGGVGYYPTSALPFVHVDTGRVRAWPRLPRAELALLFPNGHTKHQPADGGPITPDDVRTAQSRNRDLAVQLAAFHDLRNAPKAPVAIADAGVAVSQPPPRIAAVAPPKQPAPVAVVASAEPRLVEAPRVVDRPSRLSGPSNVERQRLNDLMTLAAAMPEPRLVAGPQPAVRRTREDIAIPSLAGALVAPPRTALAQGPQVAALNPSPDAMPAGSMTDAPRMNWSSGFVQAPAFDEDHPDELSYRPFPIAPFMTVSASGDDPALVTLVHPDVEKTLELLDSAGSMPPMRLRPIKAAAMWAQAFRGEAVNLGALAADELASDPSLANRRVTTTTN